MRIPVDLFIGTRYIYARRGDQLIGLNSLTAVSATALGVAVLLTILSIMNGFEDELRARILGLAGHLEVNVDTSDRQQQAELRAAIVRDPAVVAVTPFIARDVLLANRGMVRASTMRGVDPETEAQVTDLREHVVAGRLDSLAGGAFRVVMGRELADQLGVGVGDDVTLILPQPLVTPAGLVPRLKRFTIGALFEIGLQEHDGGLVLAHVDDVARLFRQPGHIDGLRVRVKDPGAVAEVKARLRQTTDAHISDWTDTHESLVRALRIEKIVMFTILAMAIAVASLNVVSNLVIAVAEKKGDIAMLAALGLERRRILRIFLYQGGITGMAGVAIGVALGYLLARHIGVIAARLEAWLGFHIFSPDVYYISAIPSVPEPFDFVVTAAAALLLASVAPLYPAWMAASVNPSAGLRHE